ncbi:hypothetical protein KGV55_01705 [Candidatus Gracilibacteria bacterium]|nr:hypothetical protein [Candidatus Gracilibacteria bacterium]
MKTKKTQKDFFTNFRLHQFKKIRMYGFIAVFAIFGGFFLNLLLKGDFDTSKLSASVSGLSQQKQDSVTDLVLQKNQDTFEMVFTKKAENIDTIEGIMIVDKQNLEINPISKDVKLIKISDSMYRFIVDMKGKTVKKGMIIARFEGKNLVENQIYLEDTQFTSGEQRYNLTKIVE